MKMNAVIIDDESRGILALQRMIERYYPEINIRGTANNIREGEALIRYTDPEIVFLDIEMPEGNGFKLLEQFSDPAFSTIFVTAYSEYAIKAIRVAALDYILKPVKPDDLRYALEKLKKRSQNKHNEQYRLLQESVNKGKPLERIMLSTLEGYYPVKTEDIIYCQAHNVYTDFFLRSGDHYLVSHSLKEYEDILNESGFFRIHKSYLINLNCIEYISKADGLTVRMVNGYELPVSFRKKDDFLSRMRTL